MHRISIYCSLAVVLVACSSDPDPPTGTAVDQGDDAAGTDAATSDASTTADMATVDPDMTAADMGPGADAGTEPDMAPPNFDETGRSGTRLRRTYVDAGDGAAMMIGMYDSALEVPCDFREAADGTLRCLPDRGYLNDLYFTDPSCTDPVHLVSEATCSQTWSIDSDDQKIYRATATAATFVDDQRYERTLDGGCRARTVDENAEYFVAELVPSIEFVAGTIDEQPRAGELVTRFIDGDDGSRLLAGTWHSLGYECFFDDEDRCVPDPEIARPDIINYADPNCTEKIYAYSNRRTAPPSVMEVRPGDFCTTEPEYFALGDEIPGTSTVYSASSGDCTEWPVTGYGWRRLGAPIDITSFPTALTERQGSGSIVARRYVDEDGSPLGSPHEFYDTATDEACTPFEAETGGAVCVPVDRGVIDPQAYLDPDCAMPNVLGFKLCDDPSAPTAMVLSDDANCELQDVPRLLEAHAPGDPAGRQYWWGAACTSLTLTSSLVGWEIGEPILDTLPLLEVKTE